MVRKILTRIALLLLIAAMVIGCTQTPPDDGAQNQEPSEDSGVHITEEYIIIVPMVADKATDRAATALRQAFQTLTGIKLDMVNERQEAVAKEIVVGACNRFDKADITAPVTLQDEKLIFYAENTTQLFAVAEAFVANCVTAGAVDENGHLHLEEEKVATLAAKITAYDARIKVLTQNLRYRDDEGGNSVAERSARFLALVNEYQPDIIGTQEATPLWTQYLDEYFSDEYTRVGVFRDGTGKAGDEANYILFRTDRFELKDSGTFWLYDGDVESVGKIEDALCNRICTWALLKDKVSGDTILACNTHLDHSTDTIRSAQLAVLLKELEYDLSQNPVIMTGDFNMLRSSAPYQAVLSQGLSDGQRSAWVDSSTVDYSCHLYQNDGEIIDYCFHSSDFRSVYARIINDDYGGYVSDHYGVLVELLPTLK